MADSKLSPDEDIYFPEIDVEDFEAYVPGGFHPAFIGESFRNGRYTIVHKLGFGGYSTIWLARDQQHQRYVSLKILAASETGKTTEGSVLRLLQDGDPTHVGKKFVPPFLDEFSFQGPNGQHQCLVGLPFGHSVSKVKEDSVDFMFPADAAKSIAAQLIMGLSYLHASGICHGGQHIDFSLVFFFFFPYNQSLTKCHCLDLHMRNFLLRIPSLDSMTTADLYQRYGEPSEVPVRRMDKRPPEPHAPAHAIFPMRTSLAADKISDPEIVISDYGTSFIPSRTTLPKLYTPALYAPPEYFFGDPITPAADIWTLGVNLYEVLGERPLFETFAWDRDDIIGEMVSTLGRLPARWWESWGKRGEFFEPNGEWASDYSRIGTPVFRRLRQRLWDMGRGETPETCQWDVAGGEMKDLEDFLRSMMAFEPTERPSAEQLMESDYMVKWALPAWKRQMERTSST